MNSGVSRISRGSTPGSDMPSALGLVTAPFRADNLIFLDEEIQSCNNKIFPRALSESEFG